MQLNGLQSIWFDVDQIRVHCLTTGQSGTPVVLLHGAGLDSAALSWDGVMESLSANHLVFAPDLPGYGQSEKPAIRYTVDFYVGFLEHMLDILHLNKVCLVGLSLGGAIALGLTLKSEARVEKLILVDTYGIQDRVVAHRLSYIYVHFPFLSKLTYWLMGRSETLVRQSLLASLIGNPSRLTDELVDRVFQALHEPGAGRAFLSTQKFDLRWSQLHTNFTIRLHGLSVPTLLIHGEQDRAVPLAYAKRAQTLIPHSALYIMQECKHWPQREKPEEFIRVVKNYLDGKAIQD
ncbi:2-hydroxymuconate semialdehyde hydrolase [Peptococcaceae bacterium CEB3]|nr:2-hydroxymuconate semialdehyde hydrolase [Peptococcaceae bacterium CEB3]